MMSRHLCFTLAALLAAGVFSTGPVRAEEPAARPLVRSYGDNRVVNVAEELAALRESGAALLGSVAPAPLSFAAARAKIDALAQSAGGETAVAAVVAATLAGNLTPAEAADVLAALASQALLIESTDLVRRVELLEDGRRTFAIAFARWNTLAAPAPTSS